MAMSKKQFFLIAGIILAISSCKNPDSIVGLNVQPASDKLTLSVVDTLTLQTLTVREDTLRSDKVLNLVGSICSSVFGKTNASAYAQVVFGSLPVFGLSTDTLSTDSLVLKLAYNGFYGDTTQQLTIHVYRLTDSLNIDSPYYSNRSFAHDIELGSLTFTPHPNTYLTEYGFAIPPQLRIPLSKSFADNILSLNGQPTLASNANWIEYFKGIYVTVDPINTPGRGCIPYFNMGSLDSKMTLYFHKGTIGDDTLFYDFQMTGARLNHQEHDYTGTVVASQLLDSTFGNSLNYIQGAAGVKVKIKIPYLKKFIQKGNIAVNRAELIIKCQKTLLDPLPPPSQLWLQEMDSTGAEAYIPDQFENSPFYGGIYDSTNTQYVFNLTHYIQDIYKGTVIDHGLFLGVSGASVLEYYGVIQANGVVIGSGQNTDLPQKMQLKLYYTKLN